MSGWVLTGLVCAVVLPAAVLVAALLWPEPSQGRSVDETRRRAQGDDCRR